MKKYLSLFGITILTVLVGRLGYQSFSSYLAGHTYYNDMISSGANRGILVAALFCIAIPVLYRLYSDKIKLKTQTLLLGIGAAVFGLIHSMIKYNVVGFGWFITIFNTFLLFALGIYLICGFAAIGSWLERKFIKFEQHRRQEMLLSFGLGMIAFLIVVEILVGINCLFGVVSWILFIGLGVMIRAERKQLGEWADLISGILTEARDGIKSGNFGFIALFILLLLALAYYYYGIQNSFIPYSTAWDANHEYMYTPKILAENHGIYWGNTVGANMPGIWHQFLIFIFSLTGATNGWFGLASDTIAVSMNNLSASFVLIFGIAVIFQIFNLISKKKTEPEIVEESKGKTKSLIMKDLENRQGILMGISTLLLWLTSGMGAFLVIVDNKTDLGVMAFSSLALLAGLIFLGNRQGKYEKKEILKYVIIAGIFFGFAALAKITAFVDFALFGLLLIALRFSPLTTAGVGMVVMGLVRKLNVLTSSVMITDTIANGLIIIGGIITIIGLVIFLSKHEKRKSFGAAVSHLIILGISFLIPFLLFKLPRTVISQIKSDNFSPTGALKSVFLSANVDNTNNKLLAQAISEDEAVLSIEEQDIIDENILTEDEKEVKTYAQCKTIGNIYSEEELNENLQEEIGNSAMEDLGRYIGYGWQTFTAEKNSIYRLLKVLWPKSNSCYGLNHDAKILCENADVIDSFKIDDLRAIYENGIKDQNSEAGELLKTAIENYNQAKTEGKIGFGTSYSALFHDDVVALRQYYQSHSIYSDDNSVNIPYRYLVPLNIVQNWSLQNLSSYYTDIGFIWIIAYIFLLISLPYAISKKNKVLTALSLTTLLGRGIWWIIGSAILWYGTVLISWTMITLAIFVNELFKKTEEDHPGILLRLLAGILMILFTTQILLNFMRIGSQGANSAFVWYKGNVGKETILDDELQSKEKIKYGYGQKEIFDLQFPQYNPIISALANRDNEDGVIVAGTYSQYFLGNQWNVKGDGMLGNFWVKASDGDLCKTYRRLKNDNTRYLIIDPNIGTVTMGEGNESLFYRFFAKLNSDKSGIEIDGTITTLVRLFDAGYLNLLSTNNLGAKYAFTLSDDEIKSAFGEGLSHEEVILARAKMAILQYFEDANEIFGVLCNIFLNRLMSNPQAGIEDIANIYGMEIDSKKIADAAKLYMSGSQPNISDFTQNEKMLLVNYLNIVMGYNSGDKNSASQMIQNLMLNSVTGGSQVIALELK